MAQEKPENKIGRNPAESGHTDWSSVWEKEDIGRWDYLSQVIFREIRNAAGDLEGKDMVELGSGSGRISKAISEKGGRVTLLDADIGVLVRSRDNFSKDKTPGRFVMGKFPDIPFAGERFDIVWSSGVLEHFSEKDFLGSLSEMSRICKKNGRIITIHPYGGSILHNLGSRFMMGSRHYPYRDEKPVATLKDKIGKVDLCRMEKEYSVGFFLLFVGMFKRLALFPSLNFVCSNIFWALSGFMCAVDNSPLGPALRFFDKVFSRIFGGYILVSVFR